MSDLRHKQIVRLTNKILKGLDGYTNGVCMAALTTVLVRIELANPSQTTDDPREALKRVLKLIEREAELFTDDAPTFGVELSKCN
jgi:hypothetical protein